MGKYKASGILVDIEIYGIHSPQILIVSVVVAIVFNSLLGRYGKVSYVDGGESLTITICLYEWYENWQR